MTWTYNVTNIGNVELKDIEVSDSKLGDICSNDTLNPGDTLTCTITGNAEKGQHSNTASVTAVYDEIDCEGIEINDTDQSYYFGYDHWAGVPTTNPLLLVGVLGIAMLLFIRREQNK